jgi:DNA mismatch repair ATPase MutS
MGALLDYLVETQRSVPKLNTPTRTTQQQHMRLDIVARRTLEIDDTFNDDGNARTLLSVLDRN